MKNKRLIKYICMLIGFMLLGVVFGFIAVSLKDIVSVEAFETHMSIAGYYGVPVITLLSFILVIVISVSYYRKAQKQAEIWDGEDEDIVDDVENKLNIALISSSTGYTFISVLLPVFLAALLNVPDNHLFSKNIVSRGLLIAEFVCFFGNIIFSLIMQQKILNLVKKISPEKQANIYDSKFASKWMDSCDEAEKITIYKAGYKAYSDTVKVISVLWTLSILGMAFLNVNGWVPIVIGIIWMTMIISYQKEAYRLEKH